jgi:hypothetical protein
MKRKNTDSAEAMGKDFSMLLCFWKQPKITIFASVVFEALLSEQAMACRNGSKEDHSNQCTSSIGVNLR